MPHHPFASYLTVYYLTCVALMFTMGTSGLTASLIDTILHIWDITSYYLASSIWTYINTKICPPLRCTSDVRRIITRSYHIVDVASYQLPVVPHNTLYKSSVVIHHRHVRMIMGSTFLLALMASSLYYNVSTLRLDQHMLSCPVLTVDCSRTVPLGGGLAGIPYNSSLEGFLSSDSNFEISKSPDNRLRVLQHGPLKFGSSGTSHGVVQGVVPLHLLFRYLTLAAARDIAALHGIDVCKRYNRKTVYSMLEKHSCKDCEGADYSTSFDIIDGAKTLKKAHNRAQHKKRTTAKRLPNLNTSDDAKEVKFPPEPLSDDLAERIISNASSKFDPSYFEEAGCAVCGLLHPVRDLSSLKSVKNLLHVLENSGVTRKERRKNTDPIKELKGPVIDYSCKNICRNCRTDLRNARVPRYALAKGLWLGRVPPELSCLRYAERLLVARVRHSVCWVKLSSGNRKLMANVVCFEVPVPQVYDVLPPPKEDIEDVLAVFFTGPEPPTEEILKRTPFLIRRNEVWRALEWLRLNHSDYADVGLSRENLDGYPENVPPVSVEFLRMSTNKSAQNTSVFDHDDKVGVEEGDCVITVHGVVGDKLNTMATRTLKSKAMKHINRKGKFLVVRHNPDPVSMFNNPGLYPQMFPWLFPYGLGGIGSIDGLSTEMHKRKCLMYHDKRFQRDTTFALVAFSHEQMFKSSTAGYLVADREYFADIADRLLSVDTRTLDDLITRMSQGERVPIESNAEKACWKVFQDLDHVLGKMPGSITSKKYMRNEVWSLVALRGSPSWYITLSPADVQHPLCIYLAGTDEKFTPELPNFDDRMRMVCGNPVAAARFFDYIVNVFTSDVLGVKTTTKREEGVFGRTSAYYGTVEQQGRLTLHLHMLIWIEGSMSPQDIRTRILDDDAWQKKIVEWLESAHCGELLNGSVPEVQEKVALRTKNDVNYVDPTMTLPVQPPVSDCRCQVHPKCQECTQRSGWWQYFKDTVDDLIVRSNLHNCKRNTNKDGSASKKRNYVGCLDNKWKKCRARFPRQLHAETKVDPKTGALAMKKGEAWLNMFTPLITYLFRSNTDITSLLSGTAVKAVIIYVTDYITKCGLKTHVAFDAIRSIVCRDSEQCYGDEKARDKARRLMTKIINLISAKMEMGAPMISMYLLGNPDHYTDHSFVHFYWTNFVNEAGRLFGKGPLFPGRENVKVGMRDGKYIPLSPHQDYMYRPDDLSHLCAYDFVRCCERIKLRTNSKGALPRGAYMFKEGHPLVDSHMLNVICRPSDYVVPNFLGGALPRKDVGDGEQYAATVLALFIPWSESSPMKKEDETWEACLERTKLPRRLSRIVDNLNLKYECLDARDDFRARLKAGTVEDNTRELGADILEYDIHGQDGYDGDLSETVPDGWQDFVDNDPELDGVPKTKRDMDRYRTVLLTSEFMAMLGWTQPLSTVAPCSVSNDRVSRKLLGSEWRAEMLKLKQAIIDSRMNTMPPAVKDSPGRRGPSASGKVFVADKSFLQKDKEYEAERKKYIDDTILEFRLNYEQEKAFRIVANHASDSYSERLNLYVGGMGGTGKSQVLKALISFFRLRNESYRLIVVAPTGSAAALLGGMTYHSAFGINDHTNTVNLSKIKDRLVGVDYVFFDEVSMLSSFEMYKISARLSRVLNTPDISFGNLNMIFAGDFAQLPPPLGGEAVSLYGRKSGMEGNNVRNQKSGIGRSRWHEVNTVVILRQNMRQKTQTTEDGKLRTALENMRYKACTMADISFLRSKISSDIPGESSINDVEFRNVSIITIPNLVKDTFNMVGSKRFAEETGQELVYFYSEDEICLHSDRSDQRRITTGLSKIRHINRQVQQALWDQTPADNNKLLPGKIGVCIGLPVMIRNNMATELCITKGQEGTVYGWQSKIGSRGRPVLDVLFVELTNPPSTVKFDGLPPNVVPIAPTTTPGVKCSLTGDRSVLVNRTQVDVLPNFSMTDFASQGKTRTYNVVDLQYSTRHQSFYTALSRGTTAAGTLILRNFATAHITGGVSSSLRQELRSLELLDEITDLRYNGKLPHAVDATYRRDLIRKFFDWKGKEYVPANVHTAIRWNKSRPWVDDDIQYEEWLMVDEKSSNTGAETKVEDPYASYVPASGTQPLDNASISLKRPLEDGTIDSSADQQSSKRLKTAHNAQSSRRERTRQPIGIRWNANSCAFDALIFLLYNLWRSDSVRWSSFSDSVGNELCTSLFNSFIKVRTRSTTIEIARDVWRHYLAREHPRTFSYAQYTSVGCLTTAVLESNHSLFSSFYRCRRCATVNGTDRYTVKSCNILLENDDATSIQNWVDKTYSTRHGRPCECGGSVDLVREYSSFYDMLLVHLPTAMSIEVSPVLRLRTNEGDVVYDLRGVVYFGNEHFISRFLCEGTTWFHDGITTGRAVVNDGPSEIVPMANCRGSLPSNALYVKR